MRGKIIFGQLIAELFNCPIIKINWLGPQTKHLFLKIVEYLKYWIMLTAAFIFLL